MQEKTQKIVKDNSEIIIREYKDKKTETCISNKNELIYKKYYVGKTLRKSIYIPKNINSTELWQETFHASGKIKTKIWAKDGLPHKEEGFALESYDENGKMILAINIKNGEIDNEQSGVFYGAKIRGKRELLILMSNEADRFINEIDIVGPLWSGD